ncbi:MAG: hypothetical protein PHV46_03380 [Bacteroidales bacterium]|nr:hypothetical protein [Bacteroidales bacterium]
MSSYKRLKSLYSLVVLGSLLLTTSCVKFPAPNPNPYSSGSRYVYPFATEVNNVTANISIELVDNESIPDIETEIPRLKYNKSTLFLLSQDDSRQDSFSSTFAAINGRPIPITEYYYDVEHLEANDLPPDTLSLCKTLGYTDGAGNEVRFSFLITICPEEEWMNVKPKITPGYTLNFNRFRMKSGLTYNNVREMMNYGVGIAYHDVKTKAVDNRDSVYSHILLSHNILMDTLKGRGCKTLVEPNGNKVYLDAAKMVPFIKVLTAQSGVNKIYPFQENSDLSQIPTWRRFILEKDFRREYEDIIKIPKEQREAVALGVHGTRLTWANNFLWMNDAYGKDGDDSVWGPNLEEYFEYNYYRVNGNIEVKQINGKIDLKVHLPSAEYFYYPSVTVNVKGIKMVDVASIKSGDEVKGMSFADYDEGVMINIDCRKYLLEHATHFVEKYEKMGLKYLKRDAIYFVNMLKESPAKRALLSRLGL